MKTLQTLFFVKTFTSGPLKGISVSDKITGEPETLRRFRIHTKGRDGFGLRAAWIITDASFQNFAR